MHRRAVAAVALLGLVILATVAILVGQRGGEPPVPPPEPTPPAARTLLVQVRDSSLLALGSVLMGVNGEGTRLDQLWWNAQWWIDQIGPQEVSAAELGRKPVPYVMETVQAQAQVPVDDAWVMDRLAFAGLVDAVSGVRLDIAEPTAYLDEEGLPQILPAGRQILAGAQAADYVLDASLRDENVRALRFRAVWDQILRRFPADPEKARTLIVSLGALSKTTLTTEALSDFLSDAKGLQVTGASGEAEVPLEPANLVRVQPPQGVRAAFALSAQRMPQRMAEVFQGYNRRQAPVARVAAAAIRSEDTIALREQLVTRGWQTAWAGRTNSTSSTVTVPADAGVEEKVQLEQAVGLTPSVGPLPWGDAQIDVARPVGS
jgi:hypothetical protein